MKNAENEKYQNVKNSLEIISKTTQQFRPEINTKKTYLRIGDINEIFLQLIILLLPENTASNHHYPAAGPAALIAELTIVKLLQLSN